MDWAVSYPKIIGFLLIPLYTQFLSPADYGILAFTASIGAVLSILYELGIAAAVTRFYYDFLEKPGEMRAYLATIWVFLTGFAFLFSLFLTWQGEALFSLLFKETPFYPYGLYIVWISFFATADVIPLMLFRVREQAKVYVIYSVSRFLVSTVAIVYFVASLQRGAVGSLQGQLLANLVYFIPFTLVTLRNAMPVIRRGYLNATLRFSLPLVPHQLSGWALSISDRILLERYVSLDQLGLYSLGYRLAMVLDLVLTSINMAWSPFFYRTAATEEDAPHTFARIVTYFTVLMLIVKSSGRPVSQRRPDHHGRSGVFGGVPGSTGRRAGFHRPWLLLHACQPAVLRQEDPQFTHLYPDRRHREYRAERAHPGAIRDYGSRLEYRDRVLHIDVPGIL